MKKAMIAMICLMLVLAIGMVAVMVVGITGGGLSIGEPPLVNRQAFSASDYETIRVSYSSESVTVLRSQSGEVVLEEYMSRYNDSMLADIDNGGGALSIRSGERGWLSMWRCKIKVYLPTDWQGTLYLESSSGSVHVEANYEALQALEVQSSSGSVHVQRVVCKGDISLKTSSGSVHAEYLETEGQVYLHANSGSVRPGEVKAETIDAESSSGSVQFESAIADRVRGHSNSGSVRFGRLEGLFELSSNSGTVEIENGSGGGNATSSSGSVRITLQQLTANLTMQSNSGSAKLYVPQGTAMHFFGKTNSGSIRTPFNDELSFNERGNEASGSVGASPEYTVDMRASSGSVTVEWI